MDGPQTGISGRSNTLLANWADGNGGGIYVNGGNVIADQDRFISNSADAGASYYLQADASLNSTNAFYGEGMATQRFVFEKSFFYYYLKLFLFVLVVVVCIFKIQLYGWKRQQFPTMRETKQVQEFIAQQAKSLSFNLTLRRILDQICFVIIVLFQIRIASVLVQHAKPMLQK